MEPEKDFNFTVGFRIRKVREGMGLSRESFSELCDISASFLTAVEGGRKAITSKTLYKICTATNTSADYYIRGNENGFEGDMLLELFQQMDDFSRDSALRILRECLSLENHYKNNSPTKT